MARGFLSGALSGVVVAGVGLGAASVATGPVFAPQPEVPEAENAVVVPAAPDQDAPPITTPSQPGVAAEQVSPGLPDEPENSAAPEVETQSAPAPDVAGVDVAGVDAAPETPDVNDAPEIGAAVDAPVTTPSETAQPEAPASEDLSISTTPAQPPAPEAEEVAMAEVEDNAEAPIAPDAPEAAQTSAAETSGETDSAAEAADQTPVVSEPVQPSLPTIAEDTPDPVAETPAEPTTEPTTEAPSEPTNEQATEDSPAAPPPVGAGASDLSKLAPEIETSRLPSVAQEAATEPEAADLPPLQAFAVPPEAAPDKPLMSIVLVDDGSTPLGLEALEAFPYPLTFAVDTEWAGATDAMARYRAAGFEVMALANIPEAAQPADVEVALSAALDMVPEAVAVLEGDNAGLQGNRDLSDQVAAMLAETGHGLVLYPKGLNTAASLALRAGVPTAPLFRDFDGQDQSASVIRRFLDQAAFKAGQEGAVVMLGRLRAETISALLIWGLQDRAARVSFVPISTVLAR